MARAVAKGKGGAGAARRGRGGSNWLSGLACGAVLAFATSVALLVGILLAPAAMAAVAEGTPGRPVTRAMALCGTAFVLDPVWRLLLAGHTMSAALDILADPLTTGGAWLAGLVGWALCEMLPVGLRIASDMRNAARISALAAEEAALRAEWDLGSESA
jgi:hypothetical protein